jgi:hypothetical protein
MRERVARGVLTLESHPTETRPRAWPWERPKGESEDEGQRRRGRQRGPHLSTRGQDGPRQDDAEQVATLEPTGVDRAHHLTSPDARVEVFNCRTLARSSAWVGEKQELDLELPNVKNGDSLLVKVIALNGVAAPEFELRYAAGCKDGRGPATGLLAVRMPEVIKPT